MLRNKTRFKSFIKLYIDFNSYILRYHVKVISNFSKNKQINRLKKIKKVRKKRHFYHARHRFARSINTCINFKIFAINSKNIIF